MVAKNWMRRSKRVSALAAAVLGLSLSAGAWACPMHGGKIVDINQETNRVVVVKGDDIASFRAPPGKATITLDGKEVSLSDLKPGDRINVNYDMNEDITKIQATRQGQG